jgi:multidrug efflux pump
VFPLVIVEGAGHEMRRTLGTAVFAGMIGVTLFGLFLTPLFYFVVRWLVERKAGAPAAAAGVPSRAQGAAVPVLPASANGERGT